MTASAWVGRRLLELAGVGLLFVLSWGLESLGRALLQPLVDRAFHRALNIRWLKIVLDGAAG